MGSSSPKENSACSKRGFTSSRPGGAESWALITALDFRVRRGLDHAGISSPLAAWRRIGEAHRVGHRKSEVGIDWSIMSDTGIEAPSHEVLVTEVAAAKVRSLLAQEGRDDLRLRIATRPGGCSGLIYQLYSDDRLLNGDALRDLDGVKVAVDRMSVPYPDGVTIDFVDSTERQGFTIDSPSVQNTCVCGESFH